MARHDALTGLPNRVVFANASSRLWWTPGGGSGFAVLSVDIDHFKQVNDTLGHPVGDELLRAVADRLQSCVREVDTVGRLGGDEFAIVQRDVKQPEDARYCWRDASSRLSVLLTTSAGTASPSESVSASRWLRRTVRVAKSCSRTPTWRSIARSPMVAGPGGSSNRRWMRGCRPASRWNWTCARR